MIPAGSTAIMASRREPPDSLDFFPTPPWATRALLKHVLPPWFVEGRHAWEPACGEGHMAEVLAEFFASVHASDVHDYGRGYAVGSFTGAGPDRATAPARVDWIITNPPFGSAEEFAERALAEAAVGVALLVRSSWIEGEARWRRIFQHRPPTVIAPFVERVAMVKGRWDPSASTATAYAWFVWLQDRPLETRVAWIRPGRKVALTKPSDFTRFAVQAPAPLLEAGA